MHCFEDMGYFCVDNLPASLLPVFTELCLRHRGILKIAVVIDIRERQFLDEFPPIFTDLKRAIRNVTLLFLEASDDTLRRRFSETRRPHPLAPDGRVEAGIQEERRVLAPLRAMADRILDTSRFNVHDLKTYIQESLLGTRREDTLFVSVVSFGFKHGIPAESDLVFDVRFLPNPFFVEALRPRNGLDPEVARHVKEHPGYAGFHRRIEDLLLYLIPEYVREGKTYLTIAVGCTGGRHRSVTLAEEIAATLRGRGYPIRITHRDLDKE
ncbi:MAG: RNase adapter RapZ [Acidobacteria bacterium]|nr:RNase adapter RapZ [Acidobacteriota bacterium]